jgi:hypothetical protein
MINHCNIGEAVNFAVEIAGSIWSLLAIWIISFPVILYENALSRF